jgi:hypothetical protein
METGRIDEGVRACDGLPSARGRGGQSAEKDGDWGWPPQAVHIIRTIPVSSSAGSIRAYTSVIYFRRLLRGPAPKI